MMLDQELSEGRQVVGDDAPTDPTLHTFLAVRQIAVQVAGPSQLADAAFDSIVETLGRAEPGLLLVQGRIWKPFTRPPKLRGSMRLNRNPLHCTPTPSKTLTIRTQPYAGIGSTATCVGVIASTYAQNRTSQNVCVRSLERH